MTCLFAGVTNRGASLHRALPLDRAGAHEDCFEECRFSALERAHQRYTPWTRRSCAVLAVVAVLCHFRLPGWMRPPGNTKGRTCYRFNINGDWQEASFPLAQVA